MCGRFANHVEAMHDWLEILGDWPAGISTGFNIAPTQSIPVVTADGTFGMRWGLIPGWATEAATQYATFNARIESAAQKPAFRNAWHKTQTCLIPARGYYEWRTENGVKQPYFIHPSHSQGPLVFAGLWDKQGENYSCTILTREAAGELQQLHSRMPVMLAQSAAKRWLSEGAAALQLLKSDTHYTTVAFHPVGRAVGNPRNQGASLVAPLASHE